MSTAAIIDWIQRKINHRRLVIAIGGMVCVLLGNYTYIHRIYHIGIPLTLIGWLLVGYAKGIYPTSKSFSDIHPDTWYLMISVLLIAMGNIVLMSFDKEIHIIVIGLLLFVFGKAALTISELHIYHAEQMLIIVSSAMIIISHMIYIIYNNLPTSSRSSVIKKYAKWTAIAGWIVFLVNSAYIYHEVEESK